eukprot:COSAG01_NODE_43165_length_432_cov_2.687688_1_plen_56_part_10
MLEPIVPRATNCGRWHDTGRGSGHSRLSTPNPVMRAPYAHAARMDAAASKQHLLLP